MDIIEDIQAKMGNAEVMTVVLTAARFFGGNIRNASDQNVMIFCPLV